MRTVFMTDKGKIRQHNEDNGGVFFNQSGQCLAIVADGMGGHRAGNVASEMTTRQLKDLWESMNYIEKADEAETWLSDSIDKINTALLDHSQANVECEGMGTTIVAAVITDSFTTIAHIGDSRCYILNETGFNQITNDHSLVNELVRTGQISKEDAKHHPRKNVLMRALGTDSKVEIDLRTIGFEEKDVLLLCSDGLSNMISEKEMVETLQSDKEISEKALSLIDLANNNGGEDNITLVIIDYFPEHMSGDEQ